MSGIQEIFQPGFCVLMQTEPVRGWHQNVVDGLEFVQPGSKSFQKACNRTCPGGLKAYHQLSDSKYVSEIPVGGDTLVVDVDLVPGRRILTGGSNLPMRIEFWEVVDGIFLTIGLKAKVLMGGTVVFDGYINPGPLAFQSVDADGPMNIGVYLDADVAIADNIDEVCFVRLVVDQITIPHPLFAAVLCC